jgi:aminoglycoside phosphotransferase (APT) family kinase protein
MAEKRLEATQNQELEKALTVLVKRRVEDCKGITGLKRLTGGASQETWAFDAVMQDGKTLPLILRRAPGGQMRESQHALPLETEAAVIALAARHGVAAPPVRCVAAPDDGLGPAYVMDRIEGETIPRRILRDEAFDTARPRLARQCGEILARLHAVPVHEDLALPLQDASAQWKLYRDLYDGFGAARPVFELAFRWLADNMPREAAAALVHGDFRHGNLMIQAENGVAAVLDWELCHLGDPMEDLGWICVNSWRFGVSEMPVGGFGAREELFAGYEAVSGQPVDDARVHFWEVFGTLKWGIMCLMMVDAFRSGFDRSVERAAIGRRASETEIDLLNLLAPPGKS